MSQMTDVSGMRMTFEGVPDDLIQTIDLIEARMDELEKKSISSARKSEDAVKKYYGAWIDGMQDAEDVSLSSLAGVQKEIEGIKAPLVSVEKQAQKSAGILGFSFNEAGIKIDKGTEGLRRFSGAASGAIGAVTGVVAVVTTLVGVVVVLTGVFRKNKEEVAAANKEYRGLQESIIETIRAGEKGEIFSDDQLFTLSKMLSESEKLSVYQRNRLFDLLEESKVTHEILRAEKQRSDQVAQTTSEYFGLQQSIEAIEAEIAGSAEKSEEARLKFRLRAIDQAWQESNKTNADAYDRAIKAEMDLHDFRMSNIAKAKEAQAESDKEKEDRAIRAYYDELGRINDKERKIRESNERIISSAADSLNQSFGEESTRLLETIVRKIDKAGRRASRP